MASIDLRRAGPVVARLRGFHPALRPTVLLRAANRGRDRVAAGLRLILPDILAVELLLAATAYLFRDAFQDRLIFHEADTSTMFYPVFAALGSALGRGELLLWSPELFTGFPLLAEGQTGVLYPPNWAAALLLPTQEGFIWLRIGHFALGVLFSYLFGRSLRLAPGPAAVTALSFGFGSFMVGQIQHGSVIASAIWLPLTLALTEIGFRSSGLARLRYAILAGAALGLSALGVHVQTVVMSGGCLVGWIAFRLLFPARREARDAGPARAAVSRVQARAWREHRSRAFARGGLPGIGRAWRLPPAFDCLATFSDLAEAAGRLARRVAGRVGLTAGLLLLVPAIGAGLAAAQLLPLYELSGQSGRASGWTYEAATDYSLPLSNLLTLVFPFFFRDGQGGGWSLWQPWEVTFYAGVVPLALAVLGVFSARRREVLFFLPLLVVATLMALGDYSPLNLYARVWNLPGINMNRAPARYSYLGVLAIAGLAGLGSQMLWDNLRTWPTGARRTHRFLLIWLAGLVAALAALVWHLVVWRAWLESDPLWVVRYLDQAYLSLRRDPGVVDSAQRVYAGLWRSLDLTNPHTALSLLLLAALLLLVVCWNELRRLRALWQSLLVLVVAVDLSSFAHAYHPLVSVDEIADIGEAGRFLARQGGLFRVYTHPEVKDPRANELLPWEVPEVRAYDPLELGRHRMLMGSIGYVDNWLLDLAGVRYRVLPANSAGLPSYRQTGFHPQQPLLSGSAFNPAGRDAWTVPGVPADELRVVSVLEEAFGLADGEPVGEWVLTDAAGTSRVLPLRAGLDTSEWTYDDPTNAVPPAHARARVAFSFDLPGPLASGARQVNLYYTSFPFPDRPTITRAEFRQTGAIGRVQIFGFGFFDRSRGQVTQFFDREKYHRVFEDQQVIVQENAAAFPRAFVAAEAIQVSSPEQALEYLAHGAIEPRRQVVLETGSARDEPPPPRPERLPTGDRLGAPYGTVQVLQYDDATVTVRATTDGGYLVLTDAYYPGWRATVDGAEVPVLRADFLFRAAQLPAGTHLVQFRYQPASFETGLAISRLTLVLSALALFVSFAPGVRGHRPSWVRTT